MRLIKKKWKMENSHLVPCDCNLIGHTVAMGGAKVPFSLIISNLHSQQLTKTDIHIKYYFNCTQILFDIE